MNILAFIFSAVLIDFDRKFITYPGFDYNPIDGSGSSNYYTLGCNSNNNNDDINWWDISLNLSKGQLAAAVLILVSSFAYIGIYIYTYIRAIQSNRNAIEMPRSVAIHTIPVVNRPYAPMSAAAPPPQSSLPSYYTDSKNINCPKCGERIEVPSNTNNSHPMNSSTVF